MRGSLRENVSLASLTWFRVGGSAQALFIPKDEADLALFLASTPHDIPVQILGVSSNTLIRDGGLPGVSIRLGPAFGQAVPVGKTCIKAGAACLDAVLARKAAKSGIAGLEFYSGIPGTIGGAIRMNAGCYDAETKDVLKEVVALDRRGRRQIMPLSELKYTYRKCGAPEELIFIEALFEGHEDLPGNIQERMKTISAKRASTQPIREKTGGSTFKNPDPRLSQGRRAWQLVEAVGGRGLEVGGAQMSNLHCNFMINTGSASAEDLETLGETIRRRVLEQENVKLEWEIKRIGLKGNEDG